MRAAAIFSLLGLVGAGLGAPASTPYQVITTEDGIPLVRSRVILVDVDASRTASPTSFRPFSTHFITEKLSQYAADIQELFRNAESKLDLLPVFTTSEKESLEAIADAEGDVISADHEGSVRTFMWMQTSSFLSCHTVLLDRYLPIIFIAIYSALIVALMLLERFEELVTNLTRAEKRIDASPKGAIFRIEEEEEEERDPCSRQILL
ncbi:hypothetical protein CDD81_3089 [Ophiocordyceps australis]|uniref:Protein BIG1 n=1 Tax=Ophiocordyceps australis TaxID=1399860 RepID=A0A2C5YCN3_9HYPO|nr:hypothetical protein CDD81_3089 [Ophiocordyceps australis]